MRCGTSNSLSKQAICRRADGDFRENSLTIGFTSTPTGGEGPANGISGGADPHQSRNAATVAAIVVAEKPAIAPGIKRDRRLIPGTEYATSLGLNFFSRRSNSRNWGSSSSFIAVFGVKFRELLRTGETRSSLIWRAVRQFRQTSGFPRDAASQFPVVPVRAIPKHF